MITQEFDQVYREYLGKELWSIPLNLLNPDFKKPLIDEEERALLALLVHRPYKGKLELFTLYHNNALSRELHTPTHEDVHSLVTVIVRRRGFSTLSYEKVDSNGQTLISRQLIPEVRLLLQLEGNPVIPINRSSGDQGLVWGVRDTKTFHVEVGGVSMSYTEEYVTPLSISEIHEINEKQEYGLHYSDCDIQLRSPHHQILRQGSWVSRCNTDDIVDVKRIAQAFNKGDTVDTYN